MKKSKTGIKRSYKQKIKRFNNINKKRNKNKSKSIRNSYSSSKSIKRLHRIVQGHINNFMNKCLNGSKEQKRTFKRKKD